MNLDEKFKQIEAHLLKLLETVGDLLLESEHDWVVELIDHGEYAVALEEVAFTFVECQIRFPAGAYRQMVLLSEKMDLDTVITPALESLVV